MPAPTVVPATSAIAPGSEPGSGASAPESSGATFDQRREDSSFASGGGEDESPAATPGGRFLGATDDSTPVVGFVTGGHAEPGRPPASADAANAPRAMSMVKRFARDAST
jgi:hypothetical protein